MPDTAISGLARLSNPTAAAQVPAIDQVPGGAAGTNGNYRLTREDLLKLLNGAPLRQPNVAAGATLAVGADDNGATFILAGAGSTLTFDAGARGAGFTFRVINDTGADWTVPAFTGATRRYDQGAAHTKVAAGGSVSVETYMRGTTMIADISGSTKA